MSNILKKFSMVDIFKRNFSCKLGSSVDYQRPTALGLYFQYRQKCSGSLTEQIWSHCPLGFYVCMFSYINDVIKHVKNLCHFTVINTKCLTYGSIPLTLGLIGRNGGLSTLCHSCRFACQQRVLKTFPGPGYLRSEDGVV